MTDIPTTPSIDPVSTDPVSDPPTPATEIPSDGDHVLPGTTAPSGEELAAAEGEVLEHTHRAIAVHLHDVEAWKMTDEGQAFINQNVKGYGV